MQTPQSIPTRELPAFRITTESGHSWITSMAEGITLQDAKSYFIGQRFNVSLDPEGEQMEVAVSVEKI